jgi:lipid II:glycine glycyltransferase (peptidoglycan interpeptide bridge formation enzyme)
MHHKTRYNIRYAQKKGVKVEEESSDLGFETFAKLYFETTKRQKYFGHDRRYHQIIWDNLKQEISHILIAYFEGTPLAAYQLFKFKDTFYYVYGGTSDLHRNLMASNLLMWEAIRLGKRLGAKILDMWGSLPPDYKQSHSWAGFTRFKEGYGTEFRQFAESRDLVINKFQYFLYNLLHGARVIYLRFRSSL